jgi:hypothetical protein
MYGTAEAMPLSKAGFSTKPRNTLEFSRKNDGTEIEVWAVGAGGFGEDDGAGALPE